MKVAIFDAHQYEKPVFEAMNARFGHDLQWYETRLTAKTADLARGHRAVCCFVNDTLNAEVLQKLKEGGVQIVALRSAGYNNVDLTAAAKLELPIVRVPAYSPHAVAEHAVALLLALNRKLYRSYWRVREHNFSLEGLVGFDLFGKTVGVIGTGQIGAVFASIMKGFGCRVIAYDPHPREDLTESGTVEYVDLPTLYKQSDVISLHVPLLPSTRHLINADALNAMKNDAILINTGRGALVDSLDLIAALKSGQIGGAGLDVYEEEEAFFFHDLSDQVLQDDVLARLLTFPNVIITSHQGFLTKEALGNIAETTLGNLSEFEQGETLTNRVRQS